MSILAYGLNYRTASVELRERVAFPEDYVTDALVQVKRDVPGVQEAAIISTCNRTELYCALHPEAEPDLAAWLSRYRPVSTSELQDASYTHWDQDAARHQIRVAAGLDSQVLGEPQIMGQVKAAYETARACGTMGPELGLLSQIILRTAKEVRTQTDIGRNPISVAYAAVSLAQQIFSDLSSKRALLLGAGETIGLVAEHLASQGIGHMAIANRTLVNAELLAAKYEADYMQLTDVAERLAEFDIVIGSTGSSLPIVGKGAAEAAIKLRRRRPIFMVDIAVPRDIEAGVGELPDVYLYTIDDLSAIIEGNIAQRRQAAASAETFVHQGAKLFLRESRVQKDQALLRAFRDQAKTIQAESLSRAKKDLQRGTDPERVLERLSNDLTNKLIHAPTMAIRDASADGRADLLDYLRILYDVDTDPDQIKNQEE
ncbi:hemA [Symbiodinium pilosum]|uniref:Glutamyl-tRNA reductase n=2 Tax=Symbiodinium TaxID=2949 RepID=A0A812IL69_SYMPI|nr:hemA [Symbiodinium pilosum]CAE7149709.1 hemA [Symbiodinium necroappetens]